MGCPVRIQWTNRAMARQRNRAPMIEAAIGKPVPVLLVTPCATSMLETLLLLRTL